MAKVTWLGEDHLHAREDGSGAGPSFVVWQGIKFPKDVAVEVANETLLAKAAINHFFKVTRVGRPPKAKDGDDQDAG